MSDEMPAAPKDRVNIVYKSKTNDIEEEQELPLKLIVVGDFSAREDDTALEDREPVSIDKDNFNEVMREHKITANISVPNRLSGETDDDTFDISFPVDTLESLGPDAIVKAVPEIHKVLMLREALKTLRARVSNVSEFRKAVERLLDDEGKRADLLKRLGIQGD